MVLITSEIWEGRKRRRRDGGGEKREGNWAERGKREKRRRESGREPQANFPITGYLRDRHYGWYYRRIRAELTFLGKITFNFTR
jgi:hypothetical protein